MHFKQVWASGRDEFVAALRALPWEAPSRPTKGRPRPQGRAFRSGRMSRNGKMQKKNGEKYGKTLGKA